MWSVGAALTMPQRAFRFRRKPPTSTPTDAHPLPHLATNLAGHITLGSQFGAEEIRNAYIPPVLLNSFDAELLELIEPGCLLSVAYKRLEGWKDRFPL
jgi:hypothetical protein